MLRSSLLVVFLVFIGASCPRQDTGPFRLTVLHTGENHGHWLPVTHPGQGDQGGIARRATVVKQVRMQRDNVLLLDSGDAGQGTLFFHQYKGAAARELYGMVGYDAVGLGNHEFDLGPEILWKNFIDGAAFAVLATNLDVSKDQWLAGKVQRYVIRQFGRQKVGILAALPRELADLSAPGPDVVAHSPIASLRDAVSELEAMGIDKIIVISHLGYREDIVVAQQVRGIDLIIGGHSATLLGRADHYPRVLGNIAGPYPTVVYNDGAPALVVHSHVWGRLLGQIHLTFDSGGRVILWDGEPIVLDASIPEDPDLQAAVARLAEPLGEISDRVVGVAAVQLDGSRDSVRNRQAPLGDIIADAMVAAAGPGVQVAIQNGGGIRASIDSGPITFGEVLAVLPFENYLVELDLDADLIRSTLEHAVSQVSIGSPGDSGGAWAQVAGLRYLVDLDQPIGKRVSEIEIRQQDGTWLPLENLTTVRVVTNSFVYAGGDGYRSLSKGTNVVERHVTLANALLSYIEQHSPVTPPQLDRVRIADQ